jgi:small-conductance mechanosensitive channel
MEELIYNIPEALVIIFFVFLLSLTIDRLLRKFSAHFDTDTSEIFRLISNSQRALLLLVAFIMALGKLGFDVSALVAGLGLTGFALGFALKDAVSNLIAGVMIVIYQPCEIGQLIEISGTKGTIIDINLRYLTLSTESGKCLIPNAMILNNKLALLEEQI